MVALLSHLPRYVRNKQLCEQSGVNMMRSFWNLLWVAAAAACFTGLGCAPAQAVQPYDWTGFYVGANIGGQQLSTDFDVNLPPPLSSFSRSTSDLGIVGGIFGGYQHQFHDMPIVLGIEADFQGANASNSFAGQELFGEISSCNFNGDWRSTGRPRYAGALATPWGGSSLM